MVVALASVGADAAEFDSSVQVADFGASGTDVGDLDNDGMPEFVDGVSGGNGKRLRAYKWNGSGFTSYNILSPVSGRKDRFAGDVELGDLNNDGYLDVIVPDSANSSSLAGALTWFENPDGNLGGAWTEHSITTWSGSGTGNEIHHMSDVEAGDINGDGWVDVVARDIDHGFWVMMRSAGGSGWETRKFVACNPREGLTLFNPDNDGDLDILLNGVWFQTPSNPVTGTYTLRAIQGAGAWYPGGSSSAQINNYASKVEVADFNADGREDFIITNAEELSAGSTPTKPKGIRLFLQPADPINGTWSEIVLSSTNYGWHTLQIGDIDEDGDLDIYSGRAWDGQEIAVFLNNGSGTSFTKQTLQATKVYQGRMGDVDADGDLDLWAPLEFNNGAVLFFENLSGTGGGVDPLSSVDVGNPAIAGGASESGGAITIFGAGADIGGSSDQLHFVYEELAGDGEITARVASLGNTSANAKAGVMIRKSLAANAANAMVLVTASGEARAQRRITDGNSTSQTVHGSVGLPYWVRLTRAGSNFTSSVSANGTNWTPVGSAQTIGMTGTAFVGLAVTSNNTGTATTAVFDNLTLPSEAPPGGNVNVALGKTATVSTGSGAAYLTDGLLTDTSRWIALSGYPQSMVVDLGTVHTINKVIVRQHTERINAYQVEVWNGSIWVTVASGTSNSAMNLEVFFDSVTTTSVRFNVSAGDYNLKIFEFEIIGTPGGGGGGDTQAPSVPSNLTATAASNSQINVGWTASTDNVGVTGYRIYRGGTQVGTTSTTSFSDTGLSASTAYTYTVAAYDAANNVSAQSGSAGATTQGSSQNVALGKTATVSTGTGANYLTDGQFTTTSRWFADYGYPQWAQVDLGGTYTVNKVVFSQNSERTDAWEVLVLIGSTWTPVASGSGNTSMIITAEFTAVSTSSVRFRVTAGELYLKVHELEVFGAP